MRVCVSDCVNYKERVAEWNDLSVMHVCDFHSEVIFD